MFDLFLLTPTPTPVPTDLSWLGPVIAVAGASVVAVISLVSLLLGKRADRRNAKAAAVDQAEIAVTPKITDGWEEVRQARMEASQYYNLYRTFENLFYTVFSALRHLVRSIRDAHPEQQFDQDVTDALAIVPPDTTDVKK